MFKKILITIILASPLLLLFVGYPIHKNQTTTHTFLATSQRCFVIGNASQFFSCFTHSTTTGGLHLLQQLTTSINYLQPFMGYTFVIFLLAQLVLIPLLVKEMFHD